MTPASMSFGRPARLGLPTGGLTLAGLTGGLLALLRRLDQWQLSQQRHEPRSAEEVLDWAQALEPSEPGFAADLRAAALRAQQAEIR